MKEEEEVSEEGQQSSVNGEATTACKGEIPGTSVTVPAA